MGGGSAINGQVATRGAPEDYDLWQAEGADGWNWRSVLPYFRKLEHDLDFSSPVHGADGPLPIRRMARRDWDGMSLAAASVFEGAGYRFVPDMNEAFVEGYSPLPITNADGQRVSSAAAYLDPATRRRPNLDILAETKVRSVLFDGRRVRGVAVAGRGGLRTITAPQVIVSAGAIHSPVLLMRSGIGPARHLRDMGIDVVVDRPGVGRELQEHPALTVSAYLKPEARVNPITRRHNSLYLRYSSGLAECPPVDMVLNVVCKSAWHPLGTRLGTIQIWVARAYSRGRVVLRPGPEGPEPDVRFELLADRRDGLRLMDGLRRVAGMLQAPPLKDCAVDGFPSSYSERVRDIGAPTLRNLLLTGGLGLLMDLSPSLRRRLIAAIVAPGASLGDLLADDDRLDSHVRRAVTGVWHACGTCRMGADDDDMAVTDGRGRVRAVHGLRVSDASVMPVIPRANTNLPTIMVAERMADLILGEA